MRLPWSPECLSFLCTQYLRPNTSSEFQTCIGLKSLVSQTFARLQGWPTLASLGRRI